MIGNSKTGRGFGGVLKYLLNGRTGKPRDRHQAYIIGGNMDGVTPKQLQSEFGFSRSLNQRVEKPVWHCSLSLPIGEQMSDHKWRIFTDQYMEKLGFTANQWVMIRHKDTDCDHVHIVASRVRLDNKKVVNDWRDKKRSQRIIRQLESEMGLTRVDSSDQKVRGATRDEYSMMVRTNEPSHKLRIQKAVQEVSEAGITLTNFIEKIQQKGIDLKFNIAKTGRISGISFKLDEFIIKGSKLGKRYTWSNLQKGGIEYIPERDLENARNASIGDLKKSDASLHQAAVEPVQPPQPQRSRANPTAKTPAIVRKELVEKQLTALGLEQCDIRVIKNGLPSQHYEWSREQVIDNLDWLARENARGADIYLGPTSPQGMILVDDLSEQKVKRIAYAGYYPSVLIESSNGNYQAWYHWPELKGNGRASTEWAKEMARIYETDLNAARWQQCGRLAGFTNRKPSRVRADGLSPFVKLKYAKESANKLPTWAVDKYLVEKEIQSQAYPVMTLEKPPHFKGESPSPTPNNTWVNYPVMRYDKPLHIQSPVTKPEDAYRKQVDYIRRKHPWGDNPDWSRLDFMAARDLLKDHEPSFVEEAIRKGAPTPERTNHDWPDYAKRTVKAAQESLRKKRRGFSR